MLDAGKRYIELIMLLPPTGDVDVNDPGYLAIIDELDTIWTGLTAAECEEIDGLLIAIDEANRTGQGYPPADTRADEE